MKNSAMRTAGVVLLILVLLASAWGVVVVALRAPSMLASLGTAISAPFSARFGGTQAAATALVDAQPPAVHATTTPSPVPQNATESQRATPALPAEQPVHQKPAAETAAPISDPNGSVDLAVNILSYVHGGARFEIVNAGTKTAPHGWIFIAKLPFQAPYTYVSAPQQELPPGAKIAFTLGWALPSQNCSAYYTMPAYGQAYPSAYPIPYPSQVCISSSAEASGNPLIITADPQGITGDTTTANNTATASL